MTSFVQTGFPVAAERAPGVATSSLVRGGMSGEFGLLGMLLSLPIALVSAMRGALLGGVRWLSKLSQGMTQSRLDWAGYSESGLQK